MASIKDNKNQKIESKSVKNKIMNVLNKPKKNDLKETVVLHKSLKKPEKRQTYETLIVSEEAVELYEHQFTEWHNNVIVKDVRKLLAKTSGQPMHQKIVTTERLTIPEQTLVVPLQVNKQIDDKTFKSSIIGIPVRIEQLDIPVVETVELVDIPYKTTKRTTQPIKDPTTGQKSNAKSDKTENTNKDEPLES